MRLALLILKENQLCTHSSIEKLRSEFGVRLIEFDNFSDDYFFQVLKKELLVYSKIDSLFIYSESEELPLGKIIALVSLLISSKTEVLTVEIEGKHKVLEKMLISINKS